MRNIKKLCSIVCIMVMLICCFDTAENGTVFADNQMAIISTMRAKVELTNSAKAQITVSGTVTDKSAGKRINILVLNPSSTKEEVKTDVSKMQYQGSTVSLSGGSYVHTFQLNLPVDFIEGEFTVYVGGDDFTIPEIHVIYYAAFSGIVNIAKTICNAQTSAQSAAEAMSTYKKALSIDSVLFENANVADVAGHLKRSLSTSAIDFSNEENAVAEMQKRIKYFSLINCFKLNKKELIFNGEEYLWDSIIPLNNIDSNGSTLLSLYSTSIKSASRINVINSLFGQDYETPDSLRKMYAKKIILNAIINNVSDGYGFISQVLTEKNAESADIAIPKYLGLQDKSPANIKIVKAKSSMTVGNMVSIIEDSSDSTISTSPTDNTSTRGGGGGNVHITAPIATAAPEPTPVPSSDPEFKDMDSVQWAIPAVSYLYNKNIISGFPDGTFKPNDNITREQAAKIICGAFGFEVADEKTSFDDVEKDQWYNKYVSTLFANDIMRGTETNKFGVGDFITREDFAAILFRCKGGDSEVNSITFTDKEEISEYAKEGVAYLQNNKIITGNEDGSFMPKGFITRAEASKIIYGLIKEAQ